MLIQWGSEWWKVDWTPIGLVFEWHSETGSLSIQNLPKWLPSCIFTIKYTIIAIQMVGTVAIF